MLARILDIISDMPTYGYRRVWAILRQQSRNEGLPFVNAKRVYRIMSENNLVLHDKLLLSLRGNIKAEDW
ncbi:transposase insD [Escherichia coli]|nr:transposase insD [Escherichia coli]